MSGPSLETVSRSARLERIKANAPRVLLVAFMAITCLLGLRSLLLGPEAAATDSGPSGYVDQAAEEFAAGFASAYLSYDARRPELRERALEPYLSADLDSGAGLLPAAGQSQRVLTTRIAQHQEALAGGVVIVVACEFEGGGEPIYLGVPVQRGTSGALQLTAYPSLVGPPTRSQGSLEPRESVEDPEIEAVAKRVLDNYLAGDSANLAADLAEDAEVSMPAQTLELGSLDEVVWAQGPELGAVLATVEASDESGTSWTLTYELGIEQSPERTYVSFIETVPTST